MVFLPYGRYTITTTAHEEAKQPEGWGLCAWRFSETDGIRNDQSGWVSVHTGTDWNMTWELRPGRTAGTYQLWTTEHENAKQPAGYTLSCWRLSEEDGVRNEHSSWVSVHQGDSWAMDWKIVPGAVDGTWRMVTAGHEPSKQVAGWGLSAWRLSETDGIRNDCSGWAACHEGDVWPMNWKFEPAGPISIPAGLKFKIRTTKHEESKQEAGWGLACWRAAADGVRGDASSWVAVHDGDEWPMVWEVQNGRKEGTYQLRTCANKVAEQPAGWGLSSFHFTEKDGVRNEHSCWLSVHDGTEWPQDWKIIHGRNQGTVQIVSTGSPDAAKTPEGWGLSAFRMSETDGIRNECSTWATCHTGSDWPMDWVLEPVSEEAGNIE